MNLTIVLPLITTLVSLVFTIMVLDQFIWRRKTYQMVWAIGLWFFALASFAQFLGTAYGWQENTNAYRLWYLCGAMATSSFLGMGTVFLMCSRKIALIILTGLIGAFVVAAVLVFTVPVDVSALPVHSTEEVTGKGFPGYVRVMTPFFNIFGVLFLGFGALQSAITFWRKRIKFYRVVSNLFIAGGAFAASSAGLIHRFNLSGSDAFSLATLLGVTLIFIGFLISIEVFEEFRIPFTKIVLKERKKALGSPVTAK
jgi:hypothetical protein